MSKAIEMTGLSKKYRDKTAVKGNNFAIEEGTLFSLLGVNGAGKTTTIKMLTGLTKPTGGEAYVCGHSILSELDEIKKISSVSTQETAVAPNLTTRENLEFMAQVYGMDRAAAKKRTDDVLKQFGLDEAEHQRAGTLSGGWQRRLSIAMAMISHPKVLYLDEPTLGLDVLARMELWDVIRAMKGSITIVLTTHYMEEAESLSDEVAVMVNGETRALGTVEKLKEQTGKETLEDAFVAIATRQQGVR
ncbi:MAG: ABC transporter ATP-binding protein [Lachnospiraceae bacterium]|nr:ABC transporter ATP-binding protein [Lachnospiraceae bacterium]